MATATVFFVFADSARVCHKVSPLPSWSVNRPRTKKFLVARSTAGFTTKSKFNFFPFLSIKTAKIIARCQHSVLHAGGDARERIKIAFNIKTLKVLQNSTFPFPAAPVSIIFLFCYHRIFNGRQIRARRAINSFSIRFPFILIIFAEIAF